MPTALSARALAGFRLRSQGYKALQDRVVCLRAGTRSSHGQRVCPSMTVQHEQLLAELCIVRAAVTEVSAQPVTVTIAGRAAAIPETRVRRDEGTYVRRGSVGRL